MYREQLNDLLIKLMGQVDDFLDETNEGITTSQENQLYDDFEKALDRIFEYPDYRSHL